MRMNSHEASDFDECLIAEVAYLWVNGGGDSELLDWCWTRIKEAVEREIAERESEQNDDLGETE